LRNPRFSRGHALVDDPRAAHVGRRIAAGITLKFSSVDAAAASFTQIREHPRPGARRF
jgi:hypothetical protein